jgi:hypothetical protein
VVFHGTGFFIANPYQSEPFGVFSIVWGAKKRKCTS